MGEEKPHGKTLADLVGQVPAKIVSYAFIILVLIFLVFSSVALYAWYKEKTLILAGYEFGSPSIRSGAIVAYAEDCPRGWSRFRPATSRVIVGAGDLFTPENGQKASIKILSIYDSGKTGGFEKVKLEQKHLPPHKHDVDVKEHTHKYNIVTGTTDNNKYGPQRAHGNIETGETLPSDLTVSVSGGGESEPHDNMPPYIALYFCQKI